VDNIFIGGEEMMVPGSLAVTGDMHFGIGNDGADFSGPGHITLDMAPGQDRVTHVWNEPNVDVRITKNEMSDTPQNASVFQLNNPFAPRPPSVVDTHLVGYSAEHCWSSRPQTSTRRNSSSHDNSDNDIDVVAFEWTNLADAQTLQRYSTFDLNAR
jgi:hypothetical protein